MIEKISMKKPSS